MPGLTLVTGGPSSGKTDYLLDLAAERYRRDPLADTLVLVPTARHADQFRQRLVRRAPVAFGLDVITLNLFAARHTAEAGIVPSEIARELLARVVYERSSSQTPAGRFRPIVDTRGLHRLVSVAISDLIADSVPPDEFAAAAGQTDDLDLRALAEIYTKFLEELARRGWHAPGERTRRAAAMSHDAVLPPVALIDGMQFLRAGDIDLIAALAERADVYVALDPSASTRTAWAVERLKAAVPGCHHVSTAQSTPGTPTLEAFTAADDESQLREVARSIKQRLVDDETLRPSDFAVVFRRTGPHLASARRVFAEYGLPLDPAAGEPLSERPFGVWVLRLLRLGVHGWRLVDVLDACSTGFFGSRAPGPEGDQLYRLRPIGRRHMLWSGLDALRQLAGVARREAGDKEAPRTALLAAAEAWTGILDSLAPLLDPDVIRTPGEHAALLDSALFGQHGLVRSDVAAIDANAPLVEPAAFRSELAALRAVDEALGAKPVAFADFIDILEARMQRPSTLIREAGGVLLAPMHTLHGLRFRHVYLAGLSEGEFPARSRTGMLLDAEARSALAAAGLPLPPEQHATEDELWQMALTRAAAITSLWRSRADATGRPTAPSYYFAAGSSSEVVHIASAREPEQAASTRELAISLTRRWPRETRRPASMPAWDAVVREAAPVEQRRRSFASAGRHEGQLPGIDVARLVDSDVAWSASRLESYRTCAFQFFARYGLRLSELDEEQAEADAATRGTVMHEMLQDALAPLATERRPLDAAGLEEAITRLHDTGREIWDTAPARYAFGRPALWRYQGQAALRDLESLLQREAAYAQRRGMTAVAGGERSFVGPLSGIDPPLVVWGQIDRIDIDDDGTILVVDYKTGRPMARKELEDGRRIQLQLYALVAGAELGARRLVARYSFLRSVKDEWELDSARSEDAGLLDSAARIASEIRASVAAGAFAVAPREPECPPYCEARTLCRVSHFSRSKTWS